MQGSLREGSVNKALVRAAIQVAPASVIVEDFGDLDGIRQLLVALDAWTRRLEKR